MGVSRAWYSWGSPYVSAPFWSREEEFTFFQEQGLLPLRFALALISSFSSHAYNESGRCLGLSRDILNHLIYHTDCIFTERRVFH